MGPGVECQEDAGESEGEKTVDRDGSNPSLTRNEVLITSGELRGLSLVGMIAMVLDMCTRLETCIRRVHG